MCRRRSGPSPHSLCATCSRSFPRWQCCRRREPRPAFRIGGSTTLRSAGAALRATMSPPASSATRPSIATPKSRPHQGPASASARSQLGVSHDAGAAAGQRHRRALVEVTSQPAPPQIEGRRTARSWSRRRPGRGAVSWSARRLAAAPVFIHVLALLATARTDAVRDSQAGGLAAQYSHKNKNARRGRRNIMGRGSAVPATSTRSEAPPNRRRAACSRKVRSPHEHSHGPSAQRHCGGLAAGRILRGGDGRRLDRVRHARRRQHRAPGLHHPRLLHRLHHERHFRHRSDPLRHHRAAGVLSVRSGASTRSTTGRSSGAAKRRCAASLSSSACCSSPRCR